MQYKGDIVFVHEPNKKKVDSETGITEHFKPSQDGKKQIAVENSPYLMDENV